jgi:hypothetical protein
MRYHLQYDGKFSLSLAGISRNLEAAGQVVLRMQNFSLHKNKYWTSHHKLAPET